MEASEKLKELFKKLNVDKQPITLGDLLDLQEALTPKEPEPKILDQRTKEGRVGRKTNNK